MLSGFKSVVVVRLEFVYILYMSYLPPAFIHTFHFYLFNYFDTMAFDLNIVRIDRPTLREGFNKNNNTMDGID